MNMPRLTNFRLLAKTAFMERTNRRAGRQNRYVNRVLWVLMSGGLALSGCISVNAPEKPIVIELNINIKQEVIYRLAADAVNTIEDNPDIF